MIRERGREDDRENQMVQSFWTIPMFSKRIFSRTNHKSRRRMDEYYAVGLLDPHLGLLVRYFEEILVGQR